ncbi:hypothetical protein IWQ62_004571 [Dispira parvispora]|uniref:Uncharacterized protein n=1 Tax=Dispira parvispora TaxID=1520584 RepID=A0A9W8ARL5_9FUNG|nr:hypothetical protein IWQ62_004571 [Dispira parvispora]
MYPSVHTAMSLLIWIFGGISVVSSLVVLVVGCTVSRWKYRRIDKVSFRLAILISLLDLWYTVFQLISSLVIPWRAVGGETGHRFRHSLDLVTELFGPTEYRQRLESLTQSPANLGNYTVSRTIIGWALDFATLAILFALVCMVFQYLREVKQVRHFLELSAERIKASRRMERIYWIGSLGLALVLSVTPLIAHGLGANPWGSPPQVGVVEPTAALWYWTSFGAWVVVYIAFASVIVTLGFHHVVAYAGPPSSHIPSFSFQHSSADSPSLCSFTDSFERYRDYGQKLGLQGSRCSLFPSDPFSHLLLEFPNRQQVNRGIVVMMLYALTPLFFQVPTVMDACFLLWAHQSPLPLKYCVAILASLQGLVHAILFMCNPILRSVWTAYRHDVYEKRRAREQALKQGLLLSDDILETPHLSPLVESSSCSSPSRTFPNASTVLSVFPTHPKSWELTNRSVCSDNFVLMGRTGGSLLCGLDEGRKRRCSLGSLFNPSRDTSGSPTLPSLSASVSASEHSTVGKSSTLGGSWPSRTPEAGIKPSPPMVQSSTTVRKSSMGNRVMEWLALRGQTLSSDSTLQTAVPIGQSVPNSTNIRGSIPTFGRSTMTSLPAGVRMSADWINSIGLTSGVQDFVSTCNLPRAQGNAAAMPYWSEWDCRSSGTAYDPTMIV